VAVADEVEDADEDALLLDEPEAVAEPVDEPLGVALLDEEPLVVGELDEVPLAGTGRRGRRC
jgi:hypothetical protein